MKIGSILHFPEFVFRNGTSKSKFFIVIYIIDDEFLLYNLPTSQQYISDSLKTDGCNNHKLLNGGYISLYFFPSDKIIGENGFKFSKDTFCSFSKGLLKGNQEKINAMSFKLIDKMLNREFLDLLICIKNSRNLQNAYVEFVDKLIDDLQNLIIQKDLF